MREKITLPRIVALLVVIALVGTVAVGPTFNNITD
jgi:hypothetical protein